MAIDILYWLLVVLVVAFGVSFSTGSGYRYYGPSVVLWIILVLIGVRVFPIALH